MTGWLPAPVEELFGPDATAEESYEVLTVDVPPTSWLASLEAARDELGCTYFDWLSAVDEPGTGFRVSAHVVALAPVRRLLVRTTVPHDAPVLPSAVEVYAGAAWHERETHEMFGVTFEGHPGLDPLLLPEGFEGHPSARTSSWPPAWPRPGRARRNRASRNTAARSAARCSRRASPTPTSGAPSRANSLPPRPARPEARPARPATARCGGPARRARARQARRLRRARLLRVPRPRARSLGVLLPVVRRLRVPGPVVSRPGPLRPVVCRMGVPRPRRAPVPQLRLGPRPDGLAA